MVETYPQVLVKNSRGGVFAGSMEIRTFFAK